MEYSYIVQFTLCAIVAFNGAICHSELYVGDNDLILKLIDKVDNMQVQIYKLEKNNKDLKRSVSALIGTTANFRIQIEELTNKLAEKDKTDEEKTKQIEELTNRLAEKDKTDEEKSKRIEDLTNQLSKSNKVKCLGGDDKSEKEYGDDEKSSEALNQEIDSKSDKSSLPRTEKRQTTDYVAFTAYLDHVIRNLGKNKAVVYNQVLLNDGAAYDANTGIFRVPITGVYLLSWSVTARKLSGEHAYDVWVKLLVNGSHQTGAVAESRDDADDNQGSNTVVLRLNQGDDVWTSHYSSYPDVFGDDTERTTTFMGVLLYVD